MKLFKSGVAALVALSASSAFALPTFTAPGGATYDPFGGIDWASSGTAWTTNFNQAAAVAGTPFSFTTNYIAYAKGSSGVLNDLNVGFTIPNLFGGSAPSGSNPFELTVSATIVEQAFCTLGGASCTFVVTGGSFDIRIDSAVNARDGASAALAQYTDGTSLIQGVISGGLGSFTSVSLGNGVGVTNFQGAVTYTNPTYISPALASSTATGTLQLGNATTGWVRPAFLGANSCSPTSTACSFAFQADSNQNFTRVPEPAGLALVGVVAAAAGIAGRRARRNKA